MKLTYSQKLTGLHTILLIVFFSSLLCSCPNPFVITILGPKTITFETNGGSRIESQTVYRDYPIKRPSNPSRGGYAFDAWYSDNETFAKKWNFDTVPNKDIILYANWKSINAAALLAVKTPPAKLVYTHGDTLDLSGLVVTLTYDGDPAEDVALDEFESKNISTDPANGATLSRTTHNGAAVTVSIGDYSESAGVLTVNKAPGAAVDPPAAATVGVNSVTLNAVSATTDQTVEYAGSGSAAPPESGWQSGTTFDGLTAGTAYYFFARSASNDNYETGAASAGAVITTMQRQIIAISLDVSELAEKSPNFDSGIILSRTGSGANQTADVVITGAYESIYWEIPGVGVYADTGVTGNSSPITLNAANPIYNSLGWVTVEVRVTVNSLQYQTSFRFRIIE